MIDKGRGADDYVNEFIFDQNNNMEDMTGKEFIKKFKEFMDDNDIEDKHMIEWSENFSEFIRDNPTCGVGAERERLLQEFLPYY